jgi:D-alanine-D-alanine ligase
LDGELLTVPTPELLTSVAIDWRTLLACGVLDEVSMSLRHQEVHLVGVGSTSGRSWPLTGLFPLLQGPFGEDGSIQGLCNFFNIPFVGPTILGAALSQDKAACKDFLRSHGIVCAKYIVVDNDFNPSTVSRMMPPPWVVKPSTQGSSLGVAYVDDTAQLSVALEHARSFGDRCLIEEYVDGIELHCYALMTAKGVKISRVSGTKSSQKIYSHEQKTNSPLQVRRFLDADFDAPLKRLIQELTYKIFSLLNGRGLARLDYFLDSNGQVLFNELNCVPAALGPVTGANPWADLGWSRADLLRELLMSAGHELHR